MESSQNLVFNITNWHEANDEVYDDDEENEDEQSDDSNRKRRRELIYAIKIYGRTENGTSVYLNVIDYKPHFYVEVPDSWDYMMIAMMISHIKEGVKKEKGFKCASGFLSHEVVMKKRLYGFTAGRKFKFVRLVFKNLISFNIFNRWIADNKITNSLLFNKPKKLKLYESNIKPFLRFIHMRDLEACGWISVQNYETLLPVSHCDINIQATWKNVSPIKIATPPKLLVVSFDIEVDSYLGDFPEATKNYGIDPATGEEIIGDKIIQIVNTFSWSGCDEPHIKTVITLHGCTQTADLADCSIVECETESDLLLQWTKCMNTHNPDYIVGYNINGFDFEYMKNRAELLGIRESFEKFCKLKMLRANFVCKNLSSSAMGENYLKYYEPFGVNVIDLYKWFQRETKHEKYTLDSMCSHYIREKVEKKLTTYDEETNLTTIATTSSYGLAKNQYVSISYEDALTDSVYEKKLLVKKIIKQTKLVNEKGKPLQKIIVEGNIPSELFQDCYTLFWCHAKDDLPIKEMFKLFRGNDDDRARIAKYCVQDCVLVIKLLEKLKIIGDIIAMANVCSVPSWWISFRGQSAKILSLVSRECAKHDFMLPTPKNNYNDDKLDSSEEEEEEDTGYEGATVIQPITGIHEDPIVVLDFASLYPRSMLYMNISHECFVNDDSYRGLPDYTYRDATYNNKDGTTTTCTFAKNNNGEIGMLPLILQMLLDKREEWKTMMKNATNSFEYDKYNSTQLAYKLTANSVYGQVGAPIGPIYLKELAASTTATGRLMLEFSSNFIEGNFATLINLAIDDENGFYEFARNMFKDSLDKKFVGKKFAYKNKEEFYKYFYTKINEIFPKSQNVKPKIIYGDTDSVFFSVQIHYKGSNEVEIDKIALGQSIKIGQLAGETIFKLLPEPQEQVYEKTMHPLILVAKKRYIGNLYEDDPEHFKLKVMGIELKRRGNAKIVKIFLGGLVDFILNTHNAKLAVKYVKDQIKKMLRGGFEIDKFIVSKNLKSHYANRQSQCHAVLADRISARTGAPVVSNERIPYVYIIVKDPPKGVKLLQGDRIEDPTYVKENNIEIDYLFYLTNQIRKPCMQFLNLISNNPDKIFDDFIAKEERRRRAMHPISYYASLEDNENTKITEQTSNNAFVIKF